MDKINEDMQKELRTRFELLPGEIQNVINSSDYQMKLFEIAKKHKLTYEQLGTLEMETTFVLMGMTHPNEFGQSMSGELKKKPEEIKDLLSEIKVGIFDPIRSALMQIYTDEAYEKPAEQKAETISNNESNVLKQSGISIENTTSQTNTPIFENRNDLMKGIENPPKSTPTVLNETLRPAPQTTGLRVPVAPYATQAQTPTPPQTPNILNNKLSGTFGIPAKENDYSIKPAPAPLPQQPGGADSYREPIE